MYLVGLSHFDGDADAWYFDLWSRAHKKSKLQWPLLAHGFLRAGFHGSTKSMSIFFHGSNDSSANLADSKSSKSFLQFPSFVRVRFFELLLGRAAFQPLSGTLQSSLLAVQRWSCWLITRPMKSWMMHGFWQLGVWMNLPKLVSWLVWEVSIQKDV